MKRLLTTVLFSSFTFWALSQTYTPSEKDSKVKFVIKNFGINTGGTFEGLKGTISYDPSSLSTMTFEVTVDANTVDTDVEARDNHLRKTEYFDVKTYPRIEFKSTKVTRTNSEGYLYLFGNLMIKGVTKEIKFPFKATPKDDGYLFEGEFKIDRRDYKVGGKSLSLSDDVTISLSVFAKKS
jgi:polyisoprenoid-binding protein YceI